MLPVIYSMSVSLDGFIAGPTGDIGWTAPDAEQFRFHVEQTATSRHTCAAGSYQEMLVWETAEQTMSGEAELEFARIWRHRDQPGGNPVLHAAAKPLDLRLIESRTFNSPRRPPSLPAHPLSLHHEAVPHPSGGAGR